MKILSVVVGMALLAGISAAHADATKDAKDSKADAAKHKPSPYPMLAFRVGQFFPQTDVARAFEGDHWFLGGIEYSLGGVLTDDNTLSADVYSKGSFTGTNVLFNARNTSGNLFTTVGVGVAFTHQIDTTFSSSSLTTLGYQVALGYNFGKGPASYFIEGKYLGCLVNDSCGFGVVVGARF